MSKQEQTQTIYIGRKPMRDYLVACLTALGSGNNRLVLKARGEAINTLVDTTEVLKRQNPLVKMDSITIGTEELEDSQSHRKRNVSTMEIIVSIS